MERDRRDSSEIGAQPEPNVDTRTAENNDNGVEHHAKEKTGNSPVDTGNNKTIPQTTSDEPAVHQYATPRELVLLSTVFTVATLMIAIDGVSLACHLDCY